MTGEEGLGTMKTTGGAPEVMTSTGGALGTMRSTEEAPETMEGGEALVIKGDFLDPEAETNGIANTGENLRVRMGESRIRPESL